MLVPMLLRPVLVLSMALFSCRLPQLAFLIGEGPDPLTANVRHLSWCANKQASDDDMVLGAGFEDSVHELVEKWAISVLRWRMTFNWFMPKLVERFRLNAGASARQLKLEVHNVSPTSSPASGNTVITIAFRGTASITDLGVPEVYVGTRTSWNLCSNVSPVDSSANTITCIVPPGNGHLLDIKVCIVHGLFVDCMYGLSICGIVYPA
jgi:IPT/TIG domain